MRPEHDNPGSEQDAVSLIRATFGELSKDDLLRAIVLIHQVVHATQGLGIEWIEAELSRMISPDDLHISPQTHHEALFSRDRCSKTRKAEYLASYFRTLLSKSQGTSQAARGRRFELAHSTRVLSRREFAVLLWMKEGKTNWEIGQILGLSERTVRFHVKSIFDKLDVTSRTQAVVQALGSGLIAT